MDPALWLLLRLRLRGWLRRLGRSLATVKGALLTALGLLLFTPQLLGFVLMAGLRSSPAHLEAVRRFGTLGLFASCVLTLLLSSGERALYFSPAEVSFLFPGPFRRRQVLAYKLAGQMLGVPILAAFLAAAFAPHAAWYGAAYVGLVLTLAFLQLVTVAVALVASTVGALAFSRGRRLALGVVAALALAALGPAGRGALLLEPLELLARAERSGVVRLGLSPLRWFVA
ncbi:MAG TPA: putative ABC exporter domain-containing protein, partial [Isosphaeraceae bacterium]